MNRQRIFPKMKRGIFSRVSGGGLIGVAYDSRTVRICIIAAVNWLVVLYAVSALGEEDALGRFQFLEQPVGWLFYTLAALVVIWSAGSSLLINYDDVASRWGARVFVCLLPTLFILCLVYYALIKTQEWYS